MSVKKVKSTDVALDIMRQPGASIPGSEISYTNSIYIPTHEGQQVKCRSAELISTGTDGVLEVHLVDDPPDRWYLMELVAGQEKGRYFDKIRSTNTTVTVAQVTLFPCA